MNLRAVLVFLTLLFSTGVLYAQGSTTDTARARQTAPGVIRGTVKDDTGGVIPGAVVTLANQNGTVQTTHSSAVGAYVFRSVPAGAYTVSATYSGLRQEGTKSVSVDPAHGATADIVMTVQTQRQEVTVTETGNNTVSTEPANNATALVLRQEDLDALPDDPDDLQADLEALAGPAAGPGGNQIFIDGFTGGRLPPKESIREIRINSNPFSAEYDKLGYGRIQIFTKPGSDRFHGQGYYNISDDIWDSKNPFLKVNPPFRTQLFGGNVSGPLGKRASFFLDLERRNIDDNGIVVATIPTPSLGHVSFQDYYPTPQRRTTVSPRVDWQLGANNTLSFRYAYLENDHLLTGVGGFMLPGLTVGNLALSSYGYTQSTNEQTAQIVETAVLTTHVVNETHFEFDRTYEATKSVSDAPTLDVGQSFVAGGSGYSSPQYPRSYDLQNYFELQNYTTITAGAHTIKAGMRIRATALYDSTPQDFNGEYSFLGGTFPVLNSSFQPTGATEQLTSIQQFLTTIQLLNANLPSLYITNILHYGPSKYTVNAGDPYMGLTQIDYGPFVQDDWRVTRNFTLSLGGRFEAQNDIPDHDDWAPRVGFAWSPDAKGANGRAKTVIRGGWGIFYDRLTVSNVLTAYRYGLNTNSQTAYTWDNPTIYNAAFNTPIPLTDLAALAGNIQQHYEIDSHLQAPRLMQTAVGVERQLFSHTQLAVNFLNSRGTHEFRTVDINAPYALPGEPPPALGYAGPRPYGDDLGDIYDYQSDGIFKQTMVLVNVNSTVGRWLTIFSRYGYSNAHSDTDGLSTLPADPYDFAADWGRSNLDIAHNFFFGGSIAWKWGLRLSPFFVAHTGTPFNITTGTDLYLQGQIAPTARPSVNGAATELVYGVPTRAGFDPEPLVPDPGTSDMIERNAATGPGFIGLNLRLSKTWGFGTTKFQGPSGGARANTGGGGGRGGGGGFGGFGGGPRGFGGGDSEHRYNLTLSVNARNIINHQNLNTPNGSLTSPYFLESTNITGGYGAEQTSSEQRRIDLQLRFSF
jgi:Carboxypeptidase regulatory-like domain